MKKQNIFYVLFLSLLGIGFFSCGPTNYNCPDPKLYSYFFSESDKSYFPYKLGDSIKYLDENNDSIVLIASKFDTSYEKEYIDAQVLGCGYESILTQEKYGINFTRKTNKNFGIRIEIIKKGDALSGYSGCKIFVRFLGGNHDKLTYEIGEYNIKTVIPSINLSGKLYYNVIYGYTLKLDSFSNVFYSKVDGIIEITLNKSFLFRKQ